jgi:sigma-B regulation protein RsbU (phosphoserine phosphatase)
MSRTLSAVNQRILADSRSDMFVTMFYGVLDPQAGTLTYCNAGHNPPYLLDIDAPGSVRRLTRTGLPLGIAENEGWGQDTVQLGPGSLLLLYTDGVTEAQGASGVMFGEERLLDVVRARLGSSAGARVSAQEIQEALLAQVHEFVGPAPQFDDLTLMAVLRGKGKVFGSS